MESDTVLTPPDSVRGKVLSGGIVARPIGRKGTILSFVFKAELGGLIPIKILHQLIVSTFNQFIQDLRSGCEAISEADSDSMSRNLEDQEFIL